MAGYFACISKAPFTAILLVTEMVGSIKHLMPLAVVALVAYMVVDLLRGEPIYAAMLDDILKKSKIPRFMAILKIVWRFLFLSVRFCRISKSETSIGQKNRR